MRERESKKKRRNSKRGGSVTTERMTFVPPPFAMLFFSFLIGAARDLQLSSSRMKSLRPRFSRKTPEGALVLKKREISEESSACSVGK